MVLRSVFRLTAVSVCLMAGCALNGDFGNRYTDVVDLQGTWLFQLDADDIGIDERWFERALPDTVRLPGSTDDVDRYRSYSSFPKSRRCSGPSTGYLWPKLRAL